MKNIQIALGLALAIGLTTNISYGTVMTSFESAQKLAVKGIIAEQSSEASYNLSSEITRKEIMKVVMNLSGKNVTASCNGEFGDVSDDWGCKYIESALGYGFVAKNAEFRPDDSITKAESMKLILKARGIEKAYNGEDWREDYMLTAYDNGLIKEKYSDHDSFASRGWIFSIAVSQKNQDDEMIQGEENMEDESMMESDEMNNDVSDAEDIISELLAGMDDSSISENGFKDYSEDLVGTNENTVLFFNATWCPSCIATKNHLNEVDFTNENILILAVDYDSSTELKTKYGVTTQHTFIQVDSEGELIKKWIGSNTLEDIKENLE